MKEILSGVAVGMQSFLSCLENGHYNGVQQAKARPASGNDGSG
jgi:hypothetical protein